MKINNIFSFAKSVTGQRDGQLKRKDARDEEASRKRRHHRRLRVIQYTLTPLLIGAHLWVGYQGAERAELTGSFYKDIAKGLEKLSIEGKFFFQQFFIIGLFLYALLLCLNSFTVRLSNPLKATVGAAALSLAVAVLLSANHSTLKQSGITQGGNQPGNTSTGGMTFWGLIHVLILERQTLLIFIGLATVITVGSIYYIMRSLLTIEYSGNGGSGIQIRLPGQTVYYLPIFPQVSWQNTKIRMQAGEQYDVELYGFVSPGALNVDDLKEFNKAFVKRQKEYNIVKDREKLTEELPPFPIWPYRPPSGYEKSLYNDRMPEMLKGHEIWQEPDYYKRDDFLTVKGQPHNKVFGIIKADIEDEPRNAENQSAYDWDNKEHREELISLSSEDYPVTIEAKHTGRLWVVINDDDIARWDNSGLFFLKLTHRGNILSRR